MIQNVSGDPPSDPQQVGGYAPRLLLGGFADRPPTRAASRRWTIIHVIQSHKITQDYFLAAIYNEKDAP